MNRVAIPKVCPKCAAANRVVRIRGDDGSNTSGSLRIGVSILSAVPITRFVCLECGFLEHYLEDRDALLEIEKLSAKSRI